VICLGAKRRHAPQVRLRLVQIRFGEVW
jgi:hypothetical protein